MKWLVSMMVATFATVGVSSDGDSKIAGRMRRDYEDCNYSYATDWRTGNELDVCQSLAAAITRAVVLKETRDKRLSGAKIARKKISVRGHKLKLSYRRKFYDQDCCMAVGPKQKWRILNDRWRGGAVNARAIARALTILEVNGVSIKWLSISVSSTSDLKKAKKLIRRLHLDKVAVIGLDPSQKNHATTIFNHEK